MKKILGLIESLALSRRLLVFMVAAVPVAGLAGLITAGMSSCSADQLPLGRQESIAELEGQADAIEAEAATEAEKAKAAAAAGDQDALEAALARIAELEAEATDVDAQISKQVADGAEENVRSFFGLFGLSNLIPGGALAENAIASLAWLAFPRPRKHAVRVLKGLNPADRELTPYDALKSLASAVGLTHSSEGSAKAFEGETTPRT